jgi:outer membrane protein OmpA-like peptidoglycan-associated protein
MANTQDQVRGTRSAKELMMLVGVLLMVGAGTIATYWVRSRGIEEATAKSDVVRTAPAATPTGLEVVHADVYFDFKSSRLRADAVRVLQENAALMSRDSAWVVLVQGYADRQGPPEYNKVLAQRRAEAVKQFLIELGVPETSVKVVTIGQDGSLCDDPDKECQRLNRRVHVEVRKLARAAAAPVRATTADAAAAPTQTRPAPSLP